jgi:ATP-dependent Clp protease protease subunit
MQFVKCDVTTYCVGQAASMGAVLLAAGTKGKRFALPNATVMLHQPQGGMGGQASDVEIRVKEMVRLRDTIINILVKHTGRTFEEIERETQRDRYFTAQEAKEFGIVDEVLQPKGK